MKLEIHRCDICGAEHSAENPVEVRVSRTAEKQPPSYYGLLLGMPYQSYPVTAASAFPDVAVDLCAACAGGFVAILRERAAARMQVAAPVKADYGALQKILMDDLRATYPNMMRKVDGNA